MNPKCRIFREGTSKLGNMLQAMVKGDIIINKYEQERCKMSLFSRNRIKTKIESLGNHGKITIDSIFSYDFIFRNKLRPYCIQDIMASQGTKNIATDPYMPLSYTNRLLSRS